MLATRPHTMITSEQGLQVPEQGLQVPEQGLQVPEQGLQEGEQGLQVPEQVLQVGHWELGTVGHPWEVAVPFTIMKGWFCTDSGVSLPW